MGKIKNYLIKKLLKGEDLRQIRTKTAEEIEETVSKTAITREKNRQKELYLEQLRDLNDQLEMKNLQAKIRQAQENLEEDEEEDGLLEEVKAGAPEDALLITLLQSVMQGKNNNNMTQAHQNTPQQSEPVVSVSFSDQQIREYLSKLDQASIQQAKMAPPQALKSRVQSISKMNDESFERALKILKEEY